MSSLNICFHCTVKHHEVNFNLVQGYGKAVA